MNIREMLSLMRKPGYVRRPEDERPVTQALAVDDENLVRANMYQPQNPQDAPVNMSSMDDMNPGVLNRDQTYDPTPWGNKKAAHYRSQALLRKRERPMNTQKPRPERPGLDTGEESGYGFEFL